MWEELPPSPDNAACRLYDLDIQPISDVNVLTHTPRKKAPIIDFLDPQCKFIAWKVLDGQSSTVEHLDP